MIVHHLIRRKHILLAIPAFLVRLIRILIHNLGMVIIDLDYFAAIETRGSCTISYFELVEVYVLVAVG